MVTLNLKTHLFLILGITFLNAIENIKKIYATPHLFLQILKLKFRKKVEDVDINLNFTVNCSDYPMSHIF